jgi:hypothetical protein
MDLWLSSSEKVNLVDDPKPFPEIDFGGNQISDNEKILSWS